MNESNVENATFASFGTSNLTVQYINMVFSALVFLTNLVIVFVLIHDRDLFNKSAFIVGLVGGDFIEAAATMVSGVLRADYLMTNRATVYVHPIDCMKTFSTLYLMGVQIPSIMILLISSERVVAVVFFTWYYQKWTPNKAWMLTLACYVFTTVSIGTGWLIVYNFSDSITIPIICSTAAVVGRIFAPYHFYLSAFCGLWSVITTLCCLKAFKNKRKKFEANGNVNLNQFIKKQWHITTSTMCLAFLDFFLVTIPDILISLVAFYPSLVLVGNYANCALCTRSMSNLAAYLIFNREFRWTFLRSFGLGHMVNSIEPIQPGRNNTT